MAVPQVEVTGLQVAWTCDFSRRMDGSEGSQSWAAGTVTSVYQRRRGHVTGRVSKGKPPFLGHFKI